MLVKRLAVEVDRSTWGRKPIPLWLQGASGICDLDLKMALLLLGSLTLPSLISPASPARTWAWLRYFLAITNDQDFRITRDFSELDPHLKTILSDDFGVALSTQWLFDRLGGFQDIVDGRSFILQFANSLEKRSKFSHCEGGAEQSA